MRTACCILASLAGITGAAAEPAAHPALAHWAAAWSRSDAPALGALHAPYARLFTPDARVQAVGRAAIADALARDIEEKPGRSLTFGRHIWRQYGTLAIASGVALARVAGPDRTDIPMALRFSMVWIAEGEGWRILDQHLSLLEFDDE